MLKVIHINLKSGKMWEFLENIVYFCGGEFVF